MCILSENILPSLTIIYIDTEQKQQNKHKMTPNMHQ